jgi:hypothetical protein
MRTGRPRTLRSVLVLAVGATLLGLVGCSTGEPSAGHGQRSATAATGSSPATTKTRATPSAAPSTPTGVTTRSLPVSKLLVVVMENHSLAQMRAGMPYTYRLATRYAYATDFHGIAHPSLPNYLAMASGDTHGVDSNDPPDRNRAVRGSSVFGAAIAAGRTAAVYAEAMPGPCALRSSGRYAVKHNPWPYFADERQACLENNLPISALGPAVRAGTLPNAGLVVPDLCHDAHDCSLGTADEWFHGWMTQILAGPDWRSGRLAVVLTADEDDHLSDNRVLTAVFHPSEHGRAVETRMDHYSLSRLFAEVTRTTPLGHAAVATSMATAFHLPMASR